MEALMRPSTRLSFLSSSPRLGSLGRTDSAGRVPTLPPKAVEILCMDPPATPPPSSSMNGMDCWAPSGGAMKDPMQRTATAANTGSPLALREWGFELVACACSWLFLAAIIIVLSTVDGKPLATLRPGLSLNTLLAFLAAGATAMALMPVGQAVAQWKWIWFRESQPLMDFARLDSASRGAWGALALACSVRWRHPVSAGAVLVALGFFTVPLSQELVAYHETDQQRAAHVRVRWGWLALLLVQTAASMAFVAYTVASTYRSRAAVLKSSPLPVLAALAPEGSRLVRRFDGGHELPTLEDLEMRARQLRVCMMNGRMVIIRDVMSRGEV